MDPALHAKMHAQLLGSWFGAFIGADVQAAKLSIAIASDARGKMTINMLSAATKGAPSTDISLDKDGLHWTQAANGMSCKVAAAVEAGSGPNKQDQLKGKMTCGQQEMPFALTKRQ